MKKILFSFLCLAMIIDLDAQTPLSLNEALEITLANNFGIQVAKNNVAIAKNNTDKSVNGYLPTVTGSAGANGSMGGFNQKFSNGNEASTSFAFSWGGNASVGANYTLLDKRRDMTLEQLKERVNLVDLQLRQTIEQNLLQVYTAYYTIGQLSENIVVLNEAMAISKDRLRRTQYQLDYGQGTGLDVLNVKVDIQRDSVNILNAKQAIENAYRNLNVAMGRNASDAFLVETGVEYAENLILDELLEEGKMENITLKINRQNLAVDEMSLKIIDLEKQPTLSASASYDFSLADSPAEAFVTFNTSRGLGANVGLSWTIFDGSRKKRIENTQLNLTNQVLGIEQLEQALEKDILNAWSNYQNALFILNVEESSVALNEENFVRTQEQVKFGRLTSLEFRQAQLNLLSAQVNYTSAKYDAKLREIELLQLVGRIPVY